MSLFALIACLVALAAVITLMRRRSLPRAAMFLRVIVPSWRFFDHIAPATLLFYRVLPRDAPPQAWEPLPAAAPRPAWALFVNARGNLELAQHTLLEQLADDLAELAPDAAAERLVSYELVASLVRSRVPERWLRCQGAQYQFKLQSQDGLPGSSPTVEDVLISKLHPLS